MSNIHRAKSSKYLIGNLFKQTLLVLFAIVILYPLFFVLMTSFKTTIDVIKTPFGITSFHIENYVNAWVIGNVGHYFKNSVYVTLITMALSILLTVIGAYSIGKLKPRGYRLFLLLFLATTFISVEMTTIPNFMLIRKLGLYNTRWGLIIPYLSTTLALSIYVLTNFFKNIPTEIEDSASIDGCGLLRLMLYIDIPLVKPAIISTMVMGFQNIWGEFYWALITVQDESLKTIPLGLINFQSQYGANYGVLTAGLMILTIPTILVFTIGSKYFIEGMTLGAVKG